jgi:hypothetical protein
LVPVKCQQAIFAKTQKSSIYFVECLGAIRQETGDKVKGIALGLSNGFPHLGIALEAV